MNKRRHLSQASSKRKRWKSPPVERSAGKVSFVGKRAKWTRVIFMAAKFKRVFRQPNRPVRDILLEEFR